MDWIKLDDKLPTAGDVVLIAILHRYQNASWKWSICLAQFTERGRWSAMDAENNTYMDPECWMPLPAPPNLTSKQEQMSKQSAESGHQDRIARAREKLDAALQEAEKESNG